ncbi:MAG: AAA family ATPase [Anaerolineae bacterium]|nr:AAA family ATPase [Anaerolineae bacterium]
MFETHPNLEAELHTLLPSYMLENLQESENLRAALQHLNSLERAVISFIPSYIAEDRALFGDRAGQDGALRDQGTLRDGVFMFADVSGFTALSEKLQRTAGALGTEMLTAVINQYFETMLEILAKSEGQLLKFAGDALLAFYPSTANPEDRRSELKAIRTGLRMQRAMREKFQPIQNEQLAALWGADHSSQLTMSIGIARGRLFESLVGNTVQRDHIIQGSLPGEAMDAEGVGERDEVIVTPEIAAGLEGKFRFLPLDEGFFQVVDDIAELDDFESALLTVRRRQGSTAGLFDLEQENLLDSLEKQTRKVKRVGLFVPPAILSGLIHSDDLHLPRENRYTTTMFIHATGFAELLAAWGEEELPRVVEYLGRYYSAVQRIVSRYGGTLTRTDPYKLGFKILTTFGAPIQHSDDPYRSVAAALEINHMLNQFTHRIHEELPLKLRRETYLQQRIGITLGETFSGEAGWSQRREYTVMGDDVNLAARLMAYADFGNILVSERIYEHVRDHFHAEPQSPIHLKGKSKPVNTFLIRDDVESAGILSTTGDMPFIGHELFMLKLDLLLQQAKLGRIKTLGLVADAGIGKTRIARQFAGTAQALKFRVAWAACQPRNRRPIWAVLVAQLLDIDLTAEPEVARQQFDEKMRDPHYAGLLIPLSNLLFGSGQAKSHTPKSESPPVRPGVNDIFTMFQQMSDDEKKRSGMFGLMRRRIEQTGETGAVLAGDSDVFKTADKATSIEQGLVKFLSSLTGTQPALIVIDDLHQADDETLDLLRAVQRGVTRGQLVLLLTYEPVPMNIEIKSEIVPDLSEDETSRLAMAILHINDLDQQLQSILWKRTSGRPLYIESLLRTLMDRDFIEVINGRASLKDQADIETLPDDVRQLVVSRVDRLSPESQHLIRVAAVLGAAFSLNALGSVGEWVNVSQGEALAAELVQAQLLEEIEPQLFTFRHGMTQSVIYETLSRAQRAKLHRAAATYYRNLSEEEMRPIQAAYHLAKCGLLPQAIEALIGAAERAEEIGKIEDAVASIKYALSLIPDDKSLQAKLDQLVPA